MELSHDMVSVTTLSCPEMFGSVIGEILMGQQGFVGGGETELASGHPSPRASEAGDKLGCVISN
jgi:hypothetical protein